MQRIIYFTLILIPFLISAQDRPEKYKNNESMTYDEVIEYYSELAASNSKAKLLKYGESDIGEPLYLFIISPSGIFDKDSIRNSEKLVMLVNNAIHPGEPCGVDASAVFAYDILQEMKDIDLTETVICIIPGYNVGGMHNRGCCSRANQNGPKQYGFRGNAKNLDLNRDFIKADSKNTKVFYKIFHDWNPDLFADTHSTNGADYPAQMTLIATAKSKMEKRLGDFFHKDYIIKLYDRVYNYYVDMSPYVYMMGDTITEGLKEYLETPRYSTGYTTLFNSLGMVTEAHMLKPYDIRVESTYNTLKAILYSGIRDRVNIKTRRKQAFENDLKTDEFEIAWELDTTKHFVVNYSAYEKKYKTSSVTGKQIHYYDTKDTIKLRIPYYNYYKPTAKAKVPDYYIIPQAWTKVIGLLESNNIEMQQIQKDTVIKTEVYYIKDYETIERPYEGHYLHYNTTVMKDTQDIQYYKGDYIINTNQKFRRFLVNTLEPHAVDSYFSWNYFDSMLQQKEWFSDYLFEPKAEKMLQENPELKKEFEQKKKEDKEFAENSWAMLYYLYKHSDNYEPTHNRYPIGRIFTNE